MKAAVFASRAQWILLACCVIRFWLMPLPSSFWVDEAGTLFVVRQGAHHPSLAIAPQVAASIYFWLPRACDRLLSFLPNVPGVMETVYRLPSVFAMAAAVALIARITARLIHPAAAWFSVFGCFALHGLTYEADNARPYALGILVVSAAVFFLIRWLDTNRLADALFFIVFAVLIWRVHLLLWPCYAVLFTYVLVRFVRKETQVHWRLAVLVFAIIGIALIPVLAEAVALSRHAGAHVIAPLPPVKELARALKLGFIATALGIAWAMRVRLRTAFFSMPPRNSLVLVLAWWLIPPTALFAYSWVSGNSVFVNRYLSFGLPGVVLAGTAAAAFLMPLERWRWAALFLGTGALILLGDWRQAWPPHHNSDWRGAAVSINALPDVGSLPILCPSPFIEAKSPVWNPAYRLPGFLYSHLAAYPVRGKLLLFPFQTSAAAEQWAAQTGLETLYPAKRFLLYGPAGGVQFWLNWYKKQREFAGWTRRRLGGDFGDVTVIEFDSSTGYR